MEEIQVGVLESVGYVISEWTRPEEAAVTGRAAVIRVREEYRPALFRMAEHNYFWILSWFHQADRSIRQVSPLQVNAGLPPFGVFGLRTASRPNPIALTLVKLVKVDGDDIYVTGLDAINGTPVLDIKPYFESDIVFSPQTPYIRPHSPAMRQGVFRKQALAHHGEACLGLELGIKMALLADEYFGQIQSDDLTVFVSGDACLTDVLQGLTRARIANPVRFAYENKKGPSSVIWEKNGQTMQLIVREDVSLADAVDKEAEELFLITHTGR